MFHCKRIDLAYIWSVDLDLNQMAEISAKNKIKNKRYR